jgi:hypothetical protein
VVLAFFYTAVIVLRQHAAGNSHIWRGPLSRFDPRVGHRSEFLQYPSGAALGLGTNFSPVSFLAGAGGDPLARTASRGVADMTQYRTDTLRGQTPDPVAYSPGDGFGSASAFPATTHAGTGYAGYGAPEPYYAGAPAATSSWVGLPGEPPRDSVAGGPGLAGRGTAAGGFGGFERM